MGDSRGNDTLDTVAAVPSVVGEGASGGANQGGSPAALARKAASIQIGEPGGGLSLPGRGRATAPGSEPSIGSYTTTSSPADAMLLEEIERSRFFLRVAGGLGLLFMGSLFVLGGNPTLKLMLAGSIAVVVVWVGVLHAQLRDPARFAPHKMTTVALVTTISAYHGVFFWGVFSPAPALIVLGIYFISRSEGATGALIVYLTCATAQAVLSSLILTGAVDDPGLYPIPEDRTLLEHLATQGLVQGIFLCTYLVGRQSRRSTMEAIEKVQHVVRQIAQREAQLLEVRQDLDRALEVGGPGRYTDQVLGGYTLGVVLGRGAMGEVYEAAHDETGQLAAVKLLHPHVVQNPSHVARFLREARAAGALSSPFVVRVLAAGDPLDATPYLVMERLTGHDLAYHLRKRRRLSMAEMRTLAEQVGSVIDEARVKSIVHRDLKPQNLFLAERPSGRPIWKILDFGVSKLGESSGTLTRGNVVGTPVYMAPEQARGEAVDYRADLYALAAIIYRCATGRPPYSGRDVPQILYSVVHQMPLRPSSLASMPEALDAVLAIGLAKNPDDRFQSATELVEALTAAVEGALDPSAAERAERLLAENPWKEH